MINLDFFKKLRFNRCEIVLNESEAYYLYSKFHNLMYRSHFLKFLRAFLYYTKYHRYHLFGDLFCSWQFDYQMPQYGNG